MEEDEVLTKSDFCFGCLGVGEDINLQKFVSSNDIIKILIKETPITLCLICSKIAQNMDNFVKNVQTSQRLLEDMALINRSTLYITKAELKPIVKLSRQDFNSITLDCNDVVDGFQVYSSKNMNVEVKLEIDMKIEDNLGDIFGEDIVDNDDFQDQSCEVKYENIEDLLKGDLDVNYEPKKVYKKRGRPKCKEKKQQTCKFNSKTVQLGILEKIYITEEQCMAERKQRAASAGWETAALRCHHCVRVFQFKVTYERHMQRHSESAGDYECNVCKQRMATPSKLKSHQLYHRIRFKCSKCDVTNICRSMIQRHYREVHEGQSLSLSCSHCTKVFNSMKALKYHRARVAAKQGPRTSCQHCGKSYADSRVLLVHLATVHGIGAELNKTHGCEVCGKTFRSPSHLKKHMLRHTDRKEFYCVECDKGFKSETSLQAHLRSTKIHVAYKELRFECKHCDQRFAVRRDAEHHTNRVHLNVRPYQCEKCDKAYVSKWSLSSHRARAHEGVTLEPKYPCPMCDKVFTRNQILKDHILTHTGERPYTCDSCGASFTQRSVLRTHVRLVHLRLARDGRPKR